MASGEDETVTIGPLRFARVVPQMARPKDIRHRRGAHGHPGVAGLGLLDGVHGKATNRVDAELIELSLIENGFRSCRFTRQDKSPPSFDPPARCSNRIGPLVFVVARRIPCEQLGRRKVSKRLYYLESPKGRDNPAESWNLARLRLDL